MGVAARYFLQQAGHVLEYEQSEVVVSSDYITTAVFEMVGLIWESVIRNLFGICSDFGETFQWRIWLNQRSRIYLESFNIKVNVQGVNVKIDDAKSPVVI